MKNDDHDDFVHLYCKTPLFELPITNRELSEWVLSRQFLGGHIPKWLKHNSTKMFRIEINQKYSLQKFIDEYNRCGLDEKIGECIFDRSPNWPDGTQSYSLQVPISKKMMLSDSKISSLKIKTTFDSDQI